MRRSVPNRVRPALGLLALLGLTALTGCGGAGTYPVQGKVLLPDGTPLRGGLISFQPADDGKHSADGEIQEDGTFALRTFEDGDGALPGKYRVAITPNEELDGENIKPPPIDERYLDADNSGLEYTVEPTSNQFEIKVAKARR